MRAPDKRAFPLGSVLAGPSAARQFVVVLCLLSTVVFVTGQTQTKKKTYRNEKSGYTLTYPDHWTPSGIQYGNAFEVRNYDRQNPDSVPERNRTSVIVIDTVNESTEVTNKFLSQFAAKLQAGDSRLVIDGHEALRIRRKVPARELGPGVRRSSPPGQTTGEPKFYWSVNTLIAHGKHLLSLEASAPADADSSVIDEAIAIHDSLRFER